MAEPLRVLFAASEAAPMTKTGGLADVAGALPTALRELDVDVRVLLPGYRDVLEAIVEPVPVARFPALGSFPSATLLAACSPRGEPLLVVSCPQLYEREGGPYLDASGHDWPDNAVRFGYLSYIAALLGTGSSPLDWACEIVHCNDWQCGLAPAYLHWAGNSRVSSLMTLHNLAYQGIFPPSMVPRLGLPPQSLDIHGVEYFGSMSFLKAGIYYADRISTVSPTYAREIQSEPLGFGLHGLLTSRRDALLGILNGIDVGFWNPATDPALRTNYDARSLELKARNTEALRHRFGLRDAPDAPLLGIVSRLIPQKGVDLVLACAERLIALPAQLLVLGTGDVALEREMAALARRHSGSVAFMRGFNEPLSHLIEGGADIFLMPSRFEPCGLNQMYSQRYGTLPVVRSTGGLADSVVNCTPATLSAGTATGFSFEAATPEAFFAAVERAVDAWRKPEVWIQLQRNAMMHDFSWKQSAAKYRDLYLEMLRRP